MTNLNYRNPEINDKHIFDSYFKKYPNPFSKYNFTTAFVWAEAWDFKFTEYKGHLLIINQFQRFEPIGPDPVSIMNELKGQFDKVKEETANKFNNYEEREEYFDYVYLTKDLAELKGSKYEAKRNFIKRFKKFEPKVCLLDDYTKEEFKELQQEWILGKDLIPDLKKEHLAVLKAINYYKELGLFGICIRINNEVVAFAIGQEINDTFIEFFEKANLKYVGIYQYVLNMLAKKINSKYINRGQDIGLEGMRKAKKSYHPVKMLKKYSVKI